MRIIQAGGEDPEGHPDAADWPFFGVREYRSVYAEVTDAPEVIPACFMGQSAQGVGVHDEEDFSNPKGELYLRIILSHVVCDEYSEDDV